MLVRGSDDIVGHLEKKLESKWAKQQPDGMFTLKTVECLGSCGTAPMLQCGSKYYEDLTTEKVDEMLEDLKAVEREELMCKQ